MAEMGEENIFSDKQSDSLNVGAAAAGGNGLVRGGPGGEPAIDGKFSDENMPDAEEHSVHEGNGEEHHGGDEAGDNEDMGGYDEEEESEGPNMMGGHNNMGAGILGGPPNFGDYGGGGGAVGGGGGPWGQPGPWERGFPGNRGPPRYVVLNIVCLLNLISCRG